MKYDVTAEIREQAGKGAARQLRRRGRIPAVLYGQGECLLLTLDPTVVTGIVRGHGGSTALLNLNISGGTKKASRTALLRDFQVDPVSGEILHADLFEISMTKPIRIKVPVRLIGGTPAGVKEGGVIHHNLRELHVECLPTAIPDAVDIDASALAINQGIHMRELTPLAGVRFLDDPDQMVVSVAAPISEAKLEALLTSGAAAEEGKEPEVIGKAKEDAVEGAEKAPTAEAAKGEKAEKTEAKAAPEAKPGEKKEAKGEKKK